MTRLAILVVAAALAGCGRADDERAVSAVTEHFLAAVEADDGEQACAQLSPGAVQALVAGLVYFTALGRWAL